MTYCYSIEQRTFVVVLNFPSLHSITILKRNDMHTKDGLDAKHEEKKVVFEVKYISKKTLVKEGSD